MGMEDGEGGLVSLPTVPPGGQVEIPEHSFRVS